MEDPAPITHHELQQTAVEPAYPSPADVPPKLIDADISDARMVFLSRCVPLRFSLPQPKQGAPA